MRSTKSKPEARQPPYDALETATRNLSVRQGERRLVLFTDGRDTCSKSTATAGVLAEHFRREGIEIFAVGLRSQESTRKRSLRSRIITPRLTHLKP